MISDQHKGAGTRSKTEEDLRPEGRLANLEALGGNVKQLAVIGHDLVADDLRRTTIVGLGTSPQTSGVLRHTKSLTKQHQHRLHSK